LFPGCASFCVFVFLRGDLFRGVRNLLIVPTEAALRRRPCGEGCAEERVATNDDLRDKQQGGANAKRQKALGTG
jgi:hypothetical protein